MRAQFIRRSAAVVAGLALAAGGLGLAGALQANAATTQQSAVSTPAAAKSITIKSDKTTAKAWTKVSFTGKTSGIATNTVVQVQRLQNGKWVNFPATTKVTSRATYSVWVQSGRVGVNKFRVVAANTASAPVSVTITK
jgi:nicotinate-nucleotide pyrophosphorylase